MYFVGLQGLRFRRVCSEYFCIIDQIRSIVCTFNLYLLSIPKYQYGEKCEPLDLMDPWKIELAAALTAVLLVVLVFVVTMFFRYGHLRAHRRRETLYAEIMRSYNTKSSKTIQNFCNNRVLEDVTYPVKTFSWSDHPSLIAEALEHGWTTFAFTYTNGSTSSNLWELCTFCTQPDRLDAEPDITWEINPSFNYMQKIRLNPGLITSKYSLQALQTALPLPGPSVLCFPQESYFEIIIISEGIGDTAGEVTLGDHNDRARLVSKLPLNLQGPRLDYMNSTSTAGCSKAARSNPENDNNNKNKNTGPRISTECQANTLGMDDKIIAVGHAAFANSMFGRLPGLDNGSVGFHSTGIVLVNGQPDADQQYSCGGWGHVGSVVGCGFNPVTREVFFTLNGKRVYTVICRSEEFGSPLYPTIAANYDVSVLANFGQNCFEYAFANAKRVCDPCSTVKTIGSFLEGNGEILSTDRIDPRGLVDLGRSVGVGVYSEGEEESDLFEIALDVET